MQIRGLTPRSAQDFAEIVIGGGLANADPSVEAIRNVMASPLGLDDSSAAFDSHAVARDVETMLAGERALWALPSKFGILVDAGGALPLADVTADIMVRAGESALADSLSMAVGMRHLAHPLLPPTPSRRLALAFLRLVREAERRCHAACARW